MLLGDKKKAETNEQVSIFIYALLLIVLQYITIGVYLTNKVNELLKIVTVEEKVFLHNIQANVWAQKSKN